MAISHFYSAVWFVLAIMFAGFVSAIAGLLLSRVLARSKATRELTSKLIALFLFLAFFFALISPAALKHFAKGSVA